LRPVACGSQVGSKGMAAVLQSHQRDYCLSERLIERIFLQRKDHIEKGEEDMLLYICTMADMDKILQALERLENGQNSLRGDVKSLHATVDQQGKAIVALQEGQKTLEQGQKSLAEHQTTLELKMEASIAYQKQAYEETTKLLLNIIEIDGQEQNTIKKRVDQIEKHLSLPPVK